MSTKVMRRITFLEICTTGTPLSPILIILGTYASYVTKCRTLYTYETQCIL